MFNLKKLKQMNTQEQSTKAKKAAIKVLTKDILKQAFKCIEAKIDKAINCGAIDINDWDADNNGMLLPKAIVIALLEDEADQYKSWGDLGKQVKRDAANIKAFFKQYLMIIVNC